MTFDRRVAEETIVLSCLSNVGIELTVVLSRDCQHLSLLDIISDQVSLQTQDDYRYEAHCFPLQSVLCQKSNLSRRYK